MAKGSNGRDTKTNKMNAGEVAKEHEELLRELFFGNDGNLPLMHQLARTVWMFRMAYQKGLDDFSGPQIWILLMLAKREPEVGLTQSELTRIMKVDASAITRMVKSMEKKDWISRQPDPNDNRLTRVFLTEKGYEIAKGLPERSLLLEQRITRSLTEQQLDELRRLLKILEYSARTEYDNLDEPTEILSELEEPTETLLEV